ncbi:hypothetical protein LTR66_016534, partial [Elasticomyces elasticus]
MATAQGQPTPDSTSSYTSHDLDYDPTFETAYQEIGSIDTSNFAVYFNAEKATCTVNLSERQLKAWLRAQNAKQ